MFNNACNTLPEAQSDEKKNGRKSIKGQKDPEKFFSLGRSVAVIVLKKIGYR